MKKRLLAFFLATDLAASLLSGCSASLQEESVPAAEDAGAEETVSSPEHSSENGKEETVYILADAAGIPRKTIVSTWLKNAGGTDSVSDLSTLSGLLNVKGNGGYTDNEDGTILWDADGGDVYYQGTSEQELPVEVSITYALDGQAVTAGELDGASGHLTMEIHYSNNTAYEATVNGESWTVYQPYLMISALMLDNQEASNVEVENGKAINSGESTVVVGFGFPGLQESLGLDLLEDGDGERIEDVTLPDYVVIDADVTDFSLAATLTLASADALESLDLDDVDSVDDLRDAMDELSDGMIDLRDGTQELYDAVWGDLTDGIDELKDGAQELYDGVWGDLSDGLEDLKDGSEELEDGAGDLEDGAGELRDGAYQLESGLETLAGNNEAIMSGAETVFKTLLATATEELQANGLLSNETELQIETYSEILSSIISNLQNIANTSGDGNNAEGMGSDNEKSEYSEEDGSTQTMTEEQVAAAIAKVQNLEGQLDNYNIFYTGLQQYTAGVSAAYQGADKLAAGASELYDGTKELKDGASELKDGIWGDLADGVSDLRDGTKELNDSVQGELNDGIEDLREGVEELNDGVIELDEDGIQKLVNLSEKDIENVYDRLMAVKDYAETAEAFGGSLPGMECSTKYIFKTDGIGE